MVKLDSVSGEETLKVEIYIGGVEGTGIYIDRPTVMDKDGKSMLLTPHEARLRDLTYATKLYADISVIYTKDGEVHATKDFNYALIGVIPLMLHSDQCLLHGQGSKVLRSMHECSLDPGGYFIVDGKEKVIVSQERITTNRLFITESKDPNYSIRAYIRCTSETSLSPRTVEFYVVNNACHADETSDCFAEPVKEDLRAVQGAILVSLPGITGSFPLTWLFRAFGITSDKAILESILGPVGEAHQAFMDFLRPSLVHGSVYTTDQVLENLKNRVFYKSIQHVKSILVQDVFPNIPDYKNKGKYLGYLVSCIMKTTLKLQPFSDRDSYVFKRVDISGFLLGQLFQECYGKFRKHVRDSIDKEYYYGPWKNTGEIELLLRKDNLHRILTPSIISDIFLRSLKGLWGPKTEDPDQSLVQDLSRISYIGFLSHLRRVNMPLDRSIKVRDPHTLHPQQWGIMCPFESPDGASIGYLKNFALLTQITFGTNPELLIPLFDELEIIPLSSVSAVVSGNNHTIRVFVNGVYYGVSQNPQKVVKTIRLYRRNGLINPFVSVAWNIRENELRIQTEAGRPCRPLIIVENQQTRLTKGYTTWYQYVFGKLLPGLDEGKYYNEGFISPYSLPAFQGQSEEQIHKRLEESACALEYLDIEEENCMLIAMKQDDIGAFHTHLEIHPTTAFSVVTQLVPFANHNQAPRVYFHAAQSKQAQGVYATNFVERFDTMAYIHHYPQRRIIGTRGSHYTGNSVMPDGTNVIVAVMTHTGFNQEDSVIINKNSIDRGLFTITAYKTMTAKEKTLSPHERLMFANPVSMRSAGCNVDDIQHAKYTLLDDNGFIPTESYIPRGQTAAVLGMVLERDVVKEVKKGVLAQQVIHKQYKDVSIFTDTNHYGKVDRVFVAQQIPGNPSRIGKVRFRKVRRPEFGDKVCSRHGQKGVIGMIIPQQDMPFTKDGIVPDIIINPHAFPSRMTMGHLVETVFAKLCCLEGILGDGTVFIPFDKEAMFDRVEQHNFERHGNELMYDGRTGRQIHTEVFLGPTFYYRLKHMVADKVQGRGKGSKVLLTHQPTSGRSAGGGLRIGEMERDVLLAYGMSQFAKESMMEKSDKYKWGICRQCGVIAAYAPERGITECSSCKKENIAPVETPYALKLLIQELEAMGLQARLSVEPLDEVSDEDAYESEDFVIMEEQQGGDADPTVIAAGVPSVQNDDSTLTVTAAGAAGQGVPESTDFHAPIATDTADGDADEDVTAPADDIADSADEEDAGSLESGDIEDPEDKEEQGQQYTGELPQPASTEGGGQTKVIDIDMSGPQTGGKKKDMGNFNEDDLDFFD